MIKKYDDNYIDISSIDAVTAIDDTFYTNDNGRYVFLVVLNGFSVKFKNNDINKIQSLRERIVKDWIEYYED